MFIEYWGLMKELIVGPRRSVNYHRVRSGGILRRFDLNVRRAGFRENDQIDIRTVCTENDVRIMNRKTAILDCASRLNFFTLPRTSTLHSWLVPGKSCIHFTRPIVAGESVAIIKQIVVLVIGRLPSASGCRERSRRKQTIGVSALPGIHP
jgi:hypothetical protein